MRSDLGRLVAVAEILQDRSSLGRGQARGPDMLGDRFHAVIYRPLLYTFDNDDEGQSVNIEQTRNILN